MPRWSEGTLAFVHQCGSPDSTRSHFDAQDFLESGTPGNKNTQDGFLNRALRTNAYAQGPGGGKPRAIALQPSLPRVLSGSYPAISMNSLKDYGIHGPIRSDAPIRGFEQMYEQAADRVFRGVAQEAFVGLKSFDSARENLDARDFEKRGYPKTAIGKRLADIATLIGTGSEIQVAVTDMGGWDTHINQGNHKGQLADRFHELSEALAAFARDLGPRFGDVCVACVTEFGRTVKENGTRGTDHGHGSVVTLLGGSVRGGKVHGIWKDLKPENLFEGRDLPVTTDIRKVLGEVLHSHLGWQNLGLVFPEAAVNRGEFLGLTRA